VLGGVRCEVPTGITRSPGGIMERTKVEDVARVLADEIVTGRAPNGIYLESEWALASRFKCSRHTVREACERLIGMGLVAKRPGEGLWIRDQHTWPLDTIAIELLALRNLEAAEGLLEQILSFHTLIMGEIAALAATRRGETDLSAMTFELANLERMLAYREDAPIAQAEQMLFTAFIGSAASRPLARSLGPFDAAYRRLDVQRPIGASWIAPPTWRLMIETLRGKKSAFARHLAGTMISPLHKGVRHSFSRRFPPLEKPMSAVAAVVPEATTH
jgi:GntR family transcriptional regulator, transcriptional repressor for pyruvate dehydrogenase complex